MQHQGFGSAHRNAGLSVGCNELVGSPKKIGRMAVNSEHNSGEVLYHWIIAENANVGSGSEGGEFADELYVVGLNEDEVSS